MELFDDELIENTLLWARARVGEVDAEDLSQQILCEAISTFRSAVSRGRRIASFYGWYWRLAENQLKIFLRLKYNSAVSLNELEDFISAGEAPDEELITAEEKRRLNYAVSRLSALHRQIIIEYYLRERPVAEIAERLNIPLGTVKRRLFDAKSELKRSFDMENTGRSSYAPADLKLVGSYGAPKYWNRLNDLIVKQILVICRSKARTAREIADEIGVSPVYFEGSLDYLTENRFIKETSKGRYLTELVILPEQARIDFKAACSELYIEMTPKLRDAILSVEDKLRAFDYYGNDFSTGRLMWLWYTWASVKLSESMTSLYRAACRKKNESLADGNGKDYRVMGYLTLPDEKIIMCGSFAPFVSNMHRHFRTAEYRQITYANLFENEPFGYDRDRALNEENIALYMRLVTSPETPLTEVEQAMAAELVGRGFLEKRGELLRPTVPVLSYKVFGQLEELLGKAVGLLALEYTERLGELGERYYLPHIRADLYEEYVNWVMKDAFFILPTALWMGMELEPERTLLELPKNYSRSSHCTAVYYK